MEYLRWGILGAGGIARRKVLPALVDSTIKVVAVMDRNRSTAKEVATTFGIPFATDSAQELLDQRIDAVYIASPVYLHHEHALSASVRRIHILLEKPLALNSKEGHEIVAACQSSGSFLQVGYMMKFHSLHRELSEILAAGDIGMPVFGRARLSCWYPPIEGSWRQQLDLGGGGALMDMGTHCIDLLEWLLGSRVVEVSAYVDTLVHSYEVEDSATMLMKFANGAHGVVDAFFCIPDACGSSLLEIYGTGGSIRGEDTIGQQPGGRVTVRRTLAKSEYDAQQNQSADNTYKTDLMLPAVNMFRAEFEYFSKCILKGSPPTINTGEAGLHLLDVVEAAYKSGSRHAVCQVRGSMQ
jgi:predicted dehydrogenase